MADAKLTELEQTGTLTLASLIYTVLDPSGTPASRAKALSSVLTLFLNSFDSDDVDEGAANLFLTEAERTKLGHLTITGSFSADAIKAKTDYITVTQAVDLDQMETDIAALANGMVYKGDWDASAGTFPGAGAAQTGWFYYVAVGGTVDGVEFTAGDNIVAKTDNASATTYAGNWSKHDQTDAVQSVAGLVGTISASGLRAALDLEIGTDVQAYSAQLGTLAGLTPSDGNVIIGNGSGFIVESGATFRTSIGLGTGDSPHFSSLHVGNASDTQLERAAAGVLSVAGKRILDAATENQPITGGAVITPKNLGTQNSGTLTVDCADCPLQRAVHGAGAFNLDVAANVAETHLYLTNSSASGSIDLTAFGSQVFGDDFDNTSGSKFLCHLGYMHDGTKFINILKLA